MPSIAFDISISNAYLEFSSFFSLLKSWKLCVFVEKNVYSYITMGQTKMCNVLPKSSLCSYSNISAPQKLQFLLISCIKELLLFFVLSLISVKSCPRSISFNTMSWLEAIFENFHEKFWRNKQKCLFLVSAASSE